MRNDLTRERLREVLEYSSRTGVFKWKMVTSNRVKIGDIAGQLDMHGYRRVNVDGVRYWAGHLAWLYVHGVWPKSEIDHVNLVKHDNRIANLREATRNENKRNVRIRKHNKCGFKGVYKHAQMKADRYVAQIFVDKKRIYLGLFKTPQAAHVAYAAASRTYHGTFGRVV